MAQQRRSTRTGSGSSGRRSTKSSGSSRSKSSTSRSSSARSATARKAAARKGGKARGRQQTARKQAKRTASGAGKAASRAGVEAKTVAELREALRKNLIRPFDLLMITRDRIEEVLDEAVKQQQIAAKDARKLATRLTDRGRKQTNDFLKDLESLMDRGRGEIESRTKPARKRGTDAARQARKQVEGFGPAWFREPGAGDLLKGLWRHGQRLGGSELLAELSGGELDLSVLAED